MGVFSLDAPEVIDDGTLVHQVLAGDQQAFQLLVERYQSRLFAMARHYTRNVVEIEDLVQDTFLKAFARLETFQHQSSFYTWLYRIATNTILDYLKRRGRNPVLSVEDPELSAPPQERATVRPDAGLERADLQRITQEVLGEMPDIFRTVLVMREFDEMAYQEIADVLGISIGTVESRLFRARARFKQKLLQKHPDFAQG